MTCAWHEALIPIRLDRQSLSFLSLLSGITHVCICPHIIMEKKKCANLKSLGNVNKIFIVYLSLPSRSSHVRGEKRSKFTFSRNSRKLATWRRRIWSHQRIRWHSSSSSRQPTTQDASYVVNKIMDLLTHNCQSPNLVQHEKQF